MGVKRLRVDIDQSGADSIPPMPEGLPPIDSENLIKRILKIIDHEIERLEKKSNAMILDLQESKLLESYLRAILAADDKLNFGKKKISEDEASKLTPEEIRAMFGELVGDGK